MGHGTALSGPLRQPTTVKEWRRIAGRLEDRASYWRGKRAAAELQDVISLNRRIDNAERNASIIRSAIRGRADDAPFTPGSPTNSPRS